jgi:hypothetical protein
MTYFNLNHFIPAPHRLYSFGGSTFVAAGIGYGYGLIGRAVYPKAGITPLNYAIWFAVAYQIKQCIDLTENRFQNFLRFKAYLEDLERTPEDQLDLKNQIRYHCWRVIQLKNNCLNAIDQAVSRIFRIRAYHAVTEANVQDASFLEMCRYRMWRVFKSTVIDNVSSLLAYQLTNRVGFTLPNHTAVPFFIVIQSIIKDVLLVPALYFYARTCNQIANDIGEGDKIAAGYRESWIRYFLPVL